MRFGISRDDGPVEEYVKTETESKKKEMEKV